jgi:hypothetical protein
VSEHDLCVRLGAIGSDLTTKLSAIDDRKCERSDELMCSNRRWCYHEQVVMGYCWLE